MVIGSQLTESRLLTLHCMAVPLSISEDKASNSTQRKTAANTELYQSGSRSSTVLYSVHSHTGKAHWANSPLLDTSVYKTQLRSACCCTHSLDGFPSESSLIVARQRIACEGQQGGWSADSIDLIPTHATSSQANIPLKLCSCVPCRARPQQFIRSCMQFWSCMPKNNSRP